VAGRRGRHSARRPGRGGGGDREGARRGADSVRGYRPATARPGRHVARGGRTADLRGRLRFRQRPDRLRYRSRARVPAAITRRPTGTVRAGQSVRCPTGDLAAGTQAGQGQRHRRGTADPHRQPRRTPAARCRAGPDTRRGRHANSTDGPAPDCGREAHPQPHRDPRRHHLGRRGRDRPDGGQGRHAGPREQDQPARAAGPVLRGGPTSFPSTELHSGHRAGRDRPASPTCTSASPHRPTVA